MRVDIKREIKECVLYARDLIKRVEYDLNFLEINQYQKILNRIISDIYYISFHLTSALLLSKDIKDIKRHTTLIYEFSQNFDFYNPIGKLFNLRNKADYDRFFQINEEEVEQLLKEVKEFYEKVLEYLKEREVLNEKEIEELKI